MGSFKDELRRKAFHFTILLVIVLYLVLYFLFTKQIALLVLVVLFLIMLFSEFLRLDLGFKIPLFHNLLRKKEKKKLHGSVFFLIAAIIALMIFDFPVAFTALLMATFGDTTAALVGKKWGKKKVYKKKTYLGSFAALVVNFVIGFFLLTNALVALLMALGAVIVEVLSDKIDDNLSVPLLAGAVGQIALMLLRI